MPACVGLKTDSAAHRQVLDRWLRAQPGRGKRRSEGRTHCRPTVAQVRGTLGCGGDLGEDAGMSITGQPLHPGLAG